MENFFYYMHVVDSFQRLLAHQRSTVSNGLWSLTVFFHPIQTNSWTWVQWTWKSSRWRTWRRFWRNGASPAKVALRSLISSAKSQSSCPSMHQLLPKHGQNCNVTKTQSTTQRNPGLNLDQTVITDQEWLMFDMFFFLKKFSDTKVPMLGVYRRST